MRRLRPDLTVEEIQRRLLDERQQKAGLGSVWRSSTATASPSKSVQAAEQDHRIGLTLQRRERHGRTINPSSIPTG
jgi:hypothetical protein